jgi:hypothetical protein
MAPFLWRLRKVPAAALFAAVLLSAGCTPSPTFRDAAPIDISADPEQGDLDAPQPFTVRSGGNTYRIFPLASYTLRGVVLGRKSYRGDPSAALAPCDLAVAWGKMAEGGLYRQLGWSQSGRWYWWESGSGFGHDNAFVARYSSNTHVIPSSAFIRKALRSIAAGDAVELKGELVRVEGRGAIEGFRWVSSLSRSDMEAGSCELLYVTSVKDGERVYR